MNSGIYTITNSINGKIYVGSSVNIKRRWQRHKRELRTNQHANTHLQRSYDKHGADAFIYAIVEFVEVDKKLLYEAEQRWMDTHAGILYNMQKAAGSTLGTKQSAETCLKRSIALKGLKRTPEQNERNRQAQLLVPRDAEKDAKFARNRLGTTMTPEHIAKTREGSKKTIAKRTPEQRYEIRRKFAITRGSFVIIDGVEYLSYNEASEKLGVSRHTLKKYGGLPPTTPSAQDVTDSLVCD